MGDPVHEDRTICPSHLLFIWAGNKEDTNCDQDVVTMCDTFLLYLGV